MFQLQSLNDQQSHSDLNDLESLLGDVSDPIHNQIDCGSSLEVKLNMLPYSTHMNLLEFRITNKVSVCRFVHAK
jgi:hypothetical protein